MAKPKKVLKCKKSKIKSIVDEMTVSDTLDVARDEFDMYSNVIKGKKTKSFKHIGNFYFFHTIKNEIPKLMLFCVLEFPMDKKDSIELNEKVISVIDFLEKIFVEVTVENIVKYNKYETEQHLVFLKILVDQSYLNED